MICGKNLLSITFYNPGANPIITIYNGSVVKADIRHNKYPNGILQTL
jgi:hypothetical protein